MIDKTDAIIEQTTDELELIEFEQIEPMIAKVEEINIIQETSDDQEMNDQDYNIINEIINDDVINVKLTDLIFRKVGKVCRKRMRQLVGFMICKSRKKRNLEPRTRLD